MPPRPSSSWISYAPMRSTTYRPPRASAPESPRPMVRQLRGRGQGKSSMGNRRRVGPRSATGGAGTMGAPDPLAGYHILEAPCPLAAMAREGVGDGEPADQ